MSKGFMTHPERVEQPGDAAFVALFVPLALAIGPALIGRLYGLAADDDGEGVSASALLTLLWPLPCFALTFLLARRRRQPGGRAALLGIAAGAIGVVAAAMGFVILELAWPNPYWCSDPSCGFGD